jgi:hypothetical protein
MMQHPGIRKKQILIPLFLILPFFSIGKDEKKGYEGYVELGGHGGLGSLNLQKAFLSKNSLQINWSLGFSLAPIDPNNGVALVFPIMIQSQYGRSQNKIELGAGQGISISTKGAFFARGTAALGYRRYSASGKRYFKIAYTPLISYLVDFQWQHWAGIGIGFKL